MELNSKMKTVIFVGFVFYFVLFAFLSFAVVQNQQNQQELDVVTFIRHITNWLRNFLLLTAVIAIIIAGYYFVTAEGDPEKVRKAKNFVIYALIGVAVGLLAESMVSLIRYIIEGSSGGGNGGNWRG